MMQGNFGQVGNWELAHIREPPVKVFVDENMVVALWLLTSCHFISITSTTGQKRQNSLKLPHKLAGLYRTAKCIYIRRSWTVGDSDKEYKYFPVGMKCTSAAMAAFI